MFSLCATIVRSVYLLAVACGFGLGGWFLLQYSVSILRAGGFNRIYAQDLVIVLFLLACVLPAGRAVIRLLRHGELVPNAHLRERPVVASLVTMSSSLAIFLVYVVLRIWLDIQPWGADDVGGPLAGLAMLATLLLVFALLTGEIVLVGRSPPGKLRSVPVS